MYLAINRTAFKQASSCLSERHSPPFDATCSGVPPRARARPSLCRQIWRMWKVGLARMLPGFAFALSLQGCYVYYTSAGLFIIIMYSNPQKLSSGEVLALRRAAGRWLKRLREKRGLSQRQMAALIDAEYYTFISQIEAGRGRVPPDRYLCWAKVLDIEPKLFVRTLLRYYDPTTYMVLFGQDDLETAPLTVPRETVPLLSRE